MPALIKSETCRLMTHKPLTTECFLIVNIEDQNAKDITNLIGSEFGNRLILKLAPKHLKCTALDNQSYKIL
ncbi:hypothetical protein CEXT_302851 [Caerostris extrusa]|uniref:LAGLIDADG homing endonuclease n=1 Tax=Caerostris extrusa TaxID=172846 RepID=A0AAV4NFU0_CAEEX|nr:hypothetical protein CEXT_302851 [Caerostris extrusa]